MIAQKHQDLEAWQEADKVRRAFIALTARPAVRQDRSFCDQAVRAAGSACRNLAEGFARFKHPEFAHFVNIAKGSLAELIDLTDEALQKGYVSAAEHQSLTRQIRAAKALSGGLHAYLSRTPTPERRPRK